jgi:hypothetical protein
MKRLCEWCTKLRVVGAEVVCRAVFLVFLYAVERYEIIHLLAR